MPAIAVKCPHCGRPDSVDDSLIGRRARCRGCGQSFALAPSGETSDSAVASTHGSWEEDRPFSHGQDAALPETIGRFLIQQRLGAGAFGAVYRAIDPTLDREVALKVPHKELQKDARAVERFLREARAAARLQHPHIVPVYETGADGDSSYIASAFIAGRSLADTIDDGRFEPRRAARIVAALAEALHAAHQQGIIHRDVKPANILLDAQDRPHLTDFGLARLAAADAKLTKVGSVLGTPAYLAPEQACGRSDEAEPASDQYSLGVTLYELLCGHVPFAGPVDVVIFHTLNTPPPALPDQEPKVPAELEAICRKTLAKKPEERYASCRELAKDLGRWLAGRPTSLESAAPLAGAGRIGSEGAGGRIAPAPIMDQPSSLQPTLTHTRDDRPAPAGRVRTFMRRLRLARRPWLLAVAAAFLLPMLGLIVYVGAHRRVARVHSGNAAAVGQAVAEATGSSRPAEPSAAAAEEPTSPTNATTPSSRTPEEDPPSLPRGLSSAELSRRVAYADAIVEAQRALASEDLEQSTTILASCAEDLRGWELHYLRRLCDPNATKRASSVSSPGSGPSGFVREEVTTIRHGLGATTDLAFSPDGTHLAVTSSGNSANPRSHLLQFDSSSGARLGVVPVDREPTGAAAYSPDGKLIATGSGDGAIRIRDAETLALLRVVKVEEPGPGDRNPVVIHNVRFSPDGRWIASAGEGGRVHVCSAEVPTQTRSGLSRSREGDGLPTEGLVSLWSFERDASDRSGRNHGTIVGRGSFASGRRGQALRLDAADAYVNAGGAESLHVSSRPFTVSAWVVFDAHGERPLADASPGRRNMAIVSQLATVDGGKSNGWRLIKQDDNRFWFIFGLQDGIGGVPGGSTTLISKTAAAAGKWYHVAAVKTGTEVALYIDGVLEDARPLPPFRDDNASKLTIGRDPDAPAGSGNVNGLIDDVSLYRRALSHADLERAHLEGRLATASATAADGGSVHADTVRTFVHDAKVLVRDVAWSPDGRRIFSGSTEIKQWDFQGGQESAPAIPHAVHDLALSRDGRRIAGADTSAALKIWDVATRELVVICEGKQRASSLDFGPDGQRLAAAGETGVQIWDAVAGRRLLELGPPTAREGSGEPPRSSKVVFSPDGRRIAATSGSGVIRIWSIPGPDAPPPRAQPDLAANPPGGVAPRGGVSNSPQPPSIGMTPARGPAEFITTRAGAIRLKQIPAGTFLMGAPEIGETTPDHKPQHTVRIARAFYLGVYEVTQAQYAAVHEPSGMRTPSWFRRYGGGRDLVADINTDQFPVEQVSWLESVQFCNTLSRREGMKPYYRIVGQKVTIPDWEGTGYRLPTEAEWEYACRAGTQTRWSYGDEYEPSNWRDHAWLDANSGVEQWDGDSLSKLHQSDHGRFLAELARRGCRPHPVGEKRPNGFGLHDMHGNVSEWCWDWFGKDYYQQGNQTDPRGPGTGVAHIYRGGNWALDRPHAYSATRPCYEPSPTARDFAIGFRIARTSP